MKTTVPGGEPSLLRLHSTPRSGWVLLIGLALAAGGCSGAPHPPDEPPAVTETPQPRYAIWDSLELDRCAAAWLIKRFVAPEAAFQIYPEGTLAVDGIPLDTPTSDYRRTQRLAVFEVVLEKHGLEDPALDELARQIHAVEIDYWAAPRDAAAQALNERLLAVLDQQDSSEEALEQSFLLFDDALREIRQKRGQDRPGQLR